MKGEDQPGLVSRTAAGLLATADLARWRRICEFLLYRPHVVDAVELADDEMDVAIRCPSCRRLTVHTLEIEDVLQWIDQPNVFEIFPGDENRYLAESLLSGLCPRCDK